MLLEQIIIYSIAFLICAWIIHRYLSSIKKKSALTISKIEKAKEEGSFEPISLHPFIDLKTCIGSGACVAACPEKDILGLVNGKASVINASSCIGHGACFHACPVEAITLRIGTESRGVELPHVNSNYETNVPGIFIAGELGGMGLIKNSVEQGIQATKSIYESVKNEKGKDPKIDLVIIGAGPAGIAASLHAKKLGINAVTLEQDSLGGTVFNFPRSKIVMTAPMELPLHGKVKLYNTSKEELLQLWEQVISKNKLDIQEQKKVEEIQHAGDHIFNVQCSDGTQFETKSVLLAIGRRGSPRKLNIPGEGLSHVAYRLIDEETIRDKKVLIVGGGDSAIEAALLLKDQNDVKLSYRKGNFTRLKRENKEYILNADKSGALEILWNTEPKKITREDVLLFNNSEELATSFPFDLVYIFAGGELPTAFLKKSGITITKRFGYVVKKHK